MNEQILHGKWRQMRGAIQQEWGRLTDDDIRMLLGGTDRLVGVLEERYGYTKERAEEEVDHFLSRFGYHSRSRWQRFQTSTLRTVQRRPWIALAFAVGAVFVLRWSFRLLSQEEKARETAENA